MKELSEKNQHISGRVLKQCYLHNKMDAYLNNNVCIFHSLL